MDWAKPSVSSFVDAGYTVVVTYSPNNAGVERWLARMVADGRQVRAYAVDVGDYDSCLQCTQKIRNDLGPVDILINNAGITRDASFKKLDKVNWDAGTRTNLDSVFNMTKPVCEGMMERGWGRIINVSSVIGSKGGFGQTNYAAAKAGMHGFTKSLALEVAKKGVTVAWIHRDQDGHRTVAGRARHQDHSADSGRPTRTARRGGCARPVFMLTRGRVCDRGQHCD